MAEHKHDHSHSHDHDHDHNEGDSYFIDQLCMVGLSGMFGMICLCLWFWQTAMLGLMLGAQFHLFVLASGFTLVALALTRGVILWNQSRDPAFLHDHGHEHHDHGHAHEHAITEKPLLSLGVKALAPHEHKPGEVCDHDHEHHAHAPGHHHHDHDEADHDHGWAPWRYVVILVPIILFLLGLPNKPPSIMAAHGDSAFAPHPDLPPEAETYIARTTALGTDTLSQLVHLGVAFNLPSGKGVYKNNRDLEAFADSAESRERAKGMIVEVRGQYSPYPGTEQVFQLVRLKISCCANDATQVNVDMVSREPIRNIKFSDWVQVTGRVDFRKDEKGSYKTVLYISKASDVVKCAPDANPYIQ